MKSGQSQQDCSARSIVCALARVVYSVGPITHVMCLKMQRHVSLNEEEVRADHASSQAGCAYATHAQHFSLAFNQLTKPRQMQLTAIAGRSASELYAYLQQVAAAAEVASWMTPAALHFHNQSQKYLLTEAMRL